MVQKILAYVMLIIYYKLLVKQTSSNNIVKNMLCFLSFLPVPQDVHRLPVLHGPL